MQHESVVKCHTDARYDWACWVSRYADTDDHALLYDFYEAYLAEHNVKNFAKWLYADECT